MISGADMALTHYSDKKITQFLRHLRWKQNFTTFGRLYDMSETWLRLSQLCLQAGFDCYGDAHFAGAFVNKFSQQDPACAKSCLGW